LWFSEDFQGFVFFFKENDQFQRLMTYEDEDMKSVDSTLEFDGEFEFEIGFDHAMTI
jgi:hypothetical protein